MGCVLSRPDLVAEGVRIRIVKKLAQGGFSEVHLCEDIDSGDKFALKKIVACDSTQAERVELEILMHRTLTHPAITPLVHTATEGSTSYLIFPFYKNGSLHDELNKRREADDYLSQKEVIRLFKEVCSAVLCIHSHGYAHRDLKTGNVMFTDDRRPVLIDFGSAVRVPIEINNVQQMRLMIDECAELCSMTYRAPELFSCEVGTTIGTDVDMWSLGCVLYAMCFFVSPFDITYEKGNSIALASQSPEKIPYPVQAPFSDALKDVIKKTLVVDPAQRPSIEQLINMVDEIDQ